MKENTPNETPIITLEVIAQRKAEKLEEVQQAKKEMVQTIHELFAPCRTQRRRRRHYATYQYRNRQFMTESRTVSRSCKRIRGYFLKKKEIT